ncbi:hypothetical protein N7509_010767 [Penicillium cosmopolitanum]|uniref:T6SS Phospholipase effector Tle1-like catalytic domain-containing protein n=1 Tax=Penicillium cosmopolitanum TaxID=1131564 RepID=A0A9W9VRW4_9EURO|nr:uncharacterized protein N7509_010767 [Penicillium cosmopolitanum]KAJ5388226.1 hypothetical protein N7509_010767 [Penicillium cosmopolitanum]
MNSTSCELLGEDYILRQRKDTKLPPIRKRIIICCDGTWQSAVSGKKNIPSNVTRLCRSLNSIGTDENGDKWQQIVWYDSGVGTTALPMGDAIEGAIGKGLEGNVIEAYNFCVLNYNPGDKIMCFGFSRGAYTARTIAGLISDIGICHKRDLNKFPDLWAVYKNIKHGKHENQGAKGDFVYQKPPQGDWAQEGSREVEVVGVYDTVGSLGMPEVLGIKLPSNDGWHNVGLSPNIKNAFQALALDEHRNAFSPAVWYLSNKTATLEEVEARKQEETLAEKKYWKLLKQAKDLKACGKATDKDVNDAAHEVNQAARAWNKASRRRVKFQNRLELHPTLKQVWFPGYHINVGGGSSETLANKGDMEEMSNIVFSWMLDQVDEFLSVDEGFIIDEQNDREQKFFQLNQILENYDARITIQKTESWGYWAWRHAKSTVSAIAHPLTPTNEPAYKKRRVYGWGVGEMEDSFTPMYWANGSKKRTPGAYDIAENGKPLGDTFEFIHPVVNFRVEQFKKMNQKDSKHPIYKPIDSSPNMTYSRREMVDAQGNPFFEYDIGFSKRPLPEWKLGGLDSYERLAISGDEAYNYVDDLDDRLKTGVRTVRRPPGPRTKKVPTEQPLGESFTDGGLQPMIETKPWGETTVTPINNSGASYSHTTTFDYDLQQGFSQSHTIESKTFVTKVSDVTISSQEVF